VLSFLCLGLRRVFEFLILLGRSADRKELEILVLRHELSILRRQARSPRYRAADRALLAVLSRALPRKRWSAFMVTPETLLRWHRAIVKRRWTYERRPPGRPPLDAECVALILRLARENPCWGHRRIGGELKKLGLTVSETSVRNLLRRHGVPPAPHRSRLSWRAFLRQQAASLIACDFFTVETVSLRRIYVLFFIELESRRVHLAGLTGNPDGAWVVQQARNLTIDLAEREWPVRLVLHDRDSKFSGAFDEVFRSEGARVVRTPIQAPNANAYAERWVRTVRSECLDWLLILGRRHLDQVLRTYVEHYNRQRPHRPWTSTCQTRSASRCHFRAPDRGPCVDEIGLAGCSMNTNSQRDDWVYAPYGLSANRRGARWLGNQRFSDDRAQAPARGGPWSRGPSARTTTGRVPCSLTPRLNRVGFELDPAPGPSSIADVLLAKHALEMALLAADHTPIDQDQRRHERDKHPERPAQDRDPGIPERHSQIARVSTELIRAGRDECGGLAVGGDGRIDPVKRAKERTREREAGDHQSASHGPAEGGRHRCRRKERLEGEPGSESDQVDERWWRDHRRGIELRRGGGRSGRWNDGVS
jgi:putative transposase